MSQLLLFFALQLLGSWACLAVGPKQEPGLGMAMGFLIGLAIAVFLALPLLLLGVFTAGSVGAVLAVGTWESHLYALAPAFSLALLATFAVALHGGLRELGVPPRVRALAVGLVIAVMLAVPLVRLHVIYIHANWAAAGYLFVFAALW